MALLTLFASRTPPFHFLGLGDLVLLIEESKLFFIAIIFPFTLRINDMLVIPAGTGIQPRYLWDCLKPFIIFILLSLPLTIIASYLGNADLGILLRANLSLLLMAIFLALLFSKLPEKYGAIYYLVIFIVYGVCPILYYLVLEFSEASWNLLVLLNPFWLYWQVNNAAIFNAAWLVQCLIWVTLIIIIATSYRIIKKKS